MKLEDYNKYYIQNADHYLIPKAVFIELYEEMANFREGTIELRSQLKGTTHCFDEEEHNRLQQENQKYKEVIDTLEFIKARAKAGATQEQINKLSINFVNSYIK